jgi:hypothetical protein
MIMRFHFTRLSVSLGMLGLALALLPLSAMAQSTPGDSDASADRLKEMTALARQVSVSTGEGVRGELVPEAIIRYDDQPRRIEDATLWAIGRKGRPVAALKVEVYPDGRALHGIVSLADSSIEAKANDGWSWTSRGPGLSLQPIPGAPAPAASDRARLLQMRELARRFTGHEYEGPTIGRLQLTLKPKPVHRYADPDAGIPDGAIFSLAYGTNPDVLIVIEARKPRGSATAVWHYGVARLGGADLVVNLDGREVWKVETIHIPHNGETYANRTLARARTGN